MREGFFVPLDKLRVLASAAPDDIAVRWTLGAFLYELCRRPPADLEGDEEGFHTEQCQLQFRDELTALLSLPDVSRLSDPERVRWEFHCSCLVEDFHRAEACFHRLREIEPSTAAENSARLGEFYLLRALSAETEDIGNAALRRLSARSSKVETSLARWATAIDDAPGVTAISELGEARHWFEKAISEGFPLPQLHRAALARCLFIEENFRRSSLLFDECVNRGGFALEDEQAVFNDELNASLHIATARAYDLAGDRGRAGILLEQCVQRFPKHGPGYRRLAELAIVTEANYQRAYEVLARWSDAEPGLDSDIWVRTLRGVGGVKTEQSVARMLDEFFDAHPKRLDWVRHAVRVHWPQFAKLSEPAQKHWLYGCWILWWRAPGFETIDYADAAKHFAIALEVELRDRVFARFLASVDVQALQADLARGSLDTRGKYAWRRILNGMGGLGDMLTECDRHRNSTLIASERFRDWLSKSCPALSDRYSRDEATRLNKVRSTSTHIGEETRERVEEVCDLCRRYLEYVLSLGA